MANPPLYWEGRIRDRCLDDMDETMDVYYNGWIEYNPDMHGFAIFYYDRAGEGQLQQLIKCNQIKPIRKKPKDRYFSFKYTPGVYFEGTEEPIYELTFHSSRNAALTFRECVRDKCLELPVEGRYPKRNNPDPEREPDAVITRHCEICHIWCTGTESWQAHTSGKEHKRNRKKVQQNCPVSSKAPPPVYHCEICDVECIGDDPWQAHNNGAPHRRKKARADGLIQLSYKNLGEFHCVICDVHAPDLEHLEIHYNGKPHKKKAARTMFSEQNQNYPRVDSRASCYTPSESSKCTNSIKEALKKQARKLEEELEKLKVIEEDEGHSSRIENFLDDLNVSSSNSKVESDENSNLNYQWKQGDACWAPYGEEWYQATIISIDEENKTCIISYNGYDEEGQVYINEIYSDADWD